jgi:ATP-dependent DNA helicase PIF1
VIGVAACNIGGTTIHSWANIGLGTDPIEKIVGKVRGNKTAYDRWMKTEILVIDEISMFPLEIFDLLCRMGSLIRGDRRPFGGLQVNMLILLLP